jgi:hypothetical protein
LRVQHLSYSLLYLSKTKETKMKNSRLAIPVAAAMALALSAIAVAQNAPRYRVEIASNNLERDAIGKAAETIPADWKAMFTNAVRASVNSPQPIAFYSGQSESNWKARLEMILVKERNRWRPIWLIRTESDGRSTCAQVMAHIAKGHTIARQYGVDPDLFSAQFQNWERDNRAALARGGRGCAGSL